MRSLSSLAAAAFISTSVPACGPMPQQVEQAGSNNPFFNIEIARAAKVCVEGGPLTQCCDVSPNDEKAMAMSKADERVDLYSSTETSGFFPCEPGSRMESDEAGRNACLEDTMSSVAEKAATCMGGSSLEPDVNCDATTGKRTVKWDCYNGPRQMMQPMNHSVPQEA